MLFHHTRYHYAFQRALKAAIAAHRAAALRALLASHDDSQFARALAELSGRAMADALSMLSESERLGVFYHLPRSARKRLSEAEDARDDVSSLKRLPTLFSPAVFARQDKHSHQAR